MARWLPRIRNGPPDIPSNPRRLTTDPCNKVPYKFESVSLQQRVDENLDHPCEDQGEPPVGSGCRYWPPAVCSPATPIGGSVSGRQYDAARPHTPGRQRTAGVWVIGTGSPARATRHLLSDDPQCARPRHIGDERQRHWQPLGFQPSSRTVGLLIVERAASASCPLSHPVPLRQYRARPA
jgi:hypothetical protein